MENREESKKEIDPNGQHEGTMSSRKKKILKTKSSYVLFMRDTQKAQEYF